MLERLHVSADHASALDVLCDGISNMTHTASMREQPLQRYFHKLPAAASVRESPMQIDVHHSGNISVSGAVTSTNNDDDDCMCVETLCDYGKKGLCLLVNKPDIEFKNCGGSLCKDTRLHHFCQMSYMSKMGMPEIHVFRCMKCLSEPI
jgi:hypothetical protein